MTAIFACSPRRDGNCDTAASLIRETCGEYAPRVTALRDFSVLPCTSCGFCAQHPGECPLQTQDDSATLFERIHSATRLVLVAPIYFYHLPAHLKSLIDRSQTQWALQASRAETAAPCRMAYPVLIGARRSGDRLFEGSLLTLRYWLDVFGYTIAPAVTLYGLDGPSDLAQDAAAREKIIQYARSFSHGT